MYLHKARKQTAIQQASGDKEALVDHENVHGCNTPPPGCPQESPTIACPSEGRRRQRRRRRWPRSTTTRKVK
uniref:Uncharacterized protein n=1 Tax=Panagrellus redivivus TaxID=6233 RepID=A0A7E4ZYP1_PANRE